MVKIFRRRRPTTAAGTAVPDDATPAAALAAGPNDAPPPAAGTAVPDDATPAATPAAVPNDAAPAAAPATALPAPDDEAPDDAAELAAIMAATTAPTRRSFFGRLGAILGRGAAIDAALWEELEETLIAADVGLPTTTALLARLRARVQQEGLRDALAVRGLLRQELTALLRRPAERGQLWSPQADPPPPPHVILVVGINGAGKTTTIAKLAKAYQDDGRRVLLAAADTFRAAGIEQLQHWGDRLEVPVIAHQAGADPGAVAYDALGAAQARGLDVVIIDTAGRLQTKKNLMAELGKIRRVLAGRCPGAPHEVLLVLDAAGGQNGLSQARLFHQATEVTGIALAKLDGTSKGGILFAIADQLGLPVRFVGTGEKAGDLAPFEAEAFVAALFAD